MNTFTLHLHDARGHERIDGVTSFVASDESGSFGLMAGHAPFMTSLQFGLARFRATGGPWEYIAVPGALLYFHDNRLALNTRRYFRDPDYRRISGQLMKRLAAEEHELAAVHDSLRRLEGEMLRRLWGLGREPVLPP